MARILPSLGLASLVFGHVSGGGFTAGDTFLVGGREIRSDSHANYTVVLDPGEYTLRMKVTDKNSNATLTPTASFRVTE